MKAHDNNHLTEINGRYYTSKFLLKNFLLIDNIDLDILQAMSYVFCLGEDKNLLVHGYKEDIEKFKLGIQKIEKNSEVRVKCHVYIEEYFTNSYKNISEEDVDALIIMSFRQYNEDSFPEDNHSNKYYEYSVTDYATKVTIANSITTVQDFIVEVNKHIKDAKRLWGLKFNSMHRLEFAMKEFSTALKSKEVHEIDFFRVYKKLLDNYIIDFLDELISKNVDLTIMSTSVSTLDYDNIIKNMVIETGVPEENIHPNDVDTYARQLIRLKNKKNIKFSKRDFDETFLRNYLKATIKANEEYVNSGELPATDKLRYLLLFYSILFLCYTNKVSYMGMEVEL